MGWFGISDSDKRQQLNASMVTDGVMLTAFKAGTDNVKGVVDQQLGSAQSLLRRLNNESSSRQYQSGAISSSAGQLAAELAIAVQDARDFQQQLGVLSSQLGEGISLVEHCLEQYNTPRGARTIRLGRPDVPPEGVDIAAFSDRLAAGLLTDSSAMFRANQVRVERTFGNIEKAETLLNGPRFNQANPHRLIHDLINRP